jgi:signal transduction histidine kinase
VIRDNKILFAQLQSLYPQVKFLFLGVAALTFVLLDIFWGKVDKSLLIGWALISTLIITCRSYFVIYSIKYLSHKNAHIHAYIFALGCLASGITWAFTSFIFLKPEETVSLIVVVTLLLGSTAGSLVTLSAYLPAFYAYNVSILIPLAWVLIAQSNPDITWIGVLVIVFLIAMIGYSHSVNRSIKQYISLRFHNESLLEEAKKQRDIAETANREKSQYLAATSHDLRQPLHALQLYLANLKRLMNSSY